MDRKHDLTLKAEIVEVMEGSDEPSMKVLVQPLYLTIPADVRAHLGDMVLINADLMIRSVNPDFETEGNSRSSRR